MMDNEKIIISDFPKQNRIVIARIGPFIINIKGLTFPINKSNLEKGLFNLE